MLRFWVPLAALCPALAQTGNIPDPRDRCRAVVERLRADGHARDAHQSLVDQLAAEETLDHALAARILFTGRRQDADTAALVAALSMGTKARTAAAWELASSRAAADPDVAEALIEALRHPDKHERNFVLLALAAAAPSTPRLAGSVAAVLRAEDDPAVPQYDYKYPRGTATLLLGALGTLTADTRVTADVERQTGSDWHIQRDAANWALGRANLPPPACPALDAAARAGLTALGDYAGRTAVTLRPGGKSVPAVHESITLALAYLDSLPAWPSPAAIEQADRSGQLAVGTRMYIMALGGIQQGAAGALLASLADPSSLFAQRAAAGRRPDRHVYKTIGERQLQLAMHYPPGWSPSDGRTAILFFSGGHRVAADANGKLPPLAHERERLGLPVVNLGPGEMHAPYCDALAAGLSVHAR